jgi:hypothetical protein
MACSGGGRVKGGGDREGALKSLVATREVVPRGWVLKQLMIIIFF